MKKSLAAAALAALTALAGCSVSTPAPADSTQPTTPTSPAATDIRRPAPSGTSAQATGTQTTVAQATGTKEACELFNKLVADYAAVPPTDANGFEDVYLKAQDAKDTVSGGLEGLFASLSLLAIDRSSAAETGGQPSQESQDAVRDAVFANSATCTAEGVTLRL